MANTYTQIHIHTVFTVKNRQSLIHNNWQNRLYNYIIAIIQSYEHKVLSIGGTADHIHILFGFRPTQSLSELLQIIKRNSSEWVNKEKLTLRRFSWQEGFGAFSYSKSQVLKVIRYIENQEEHHKKKTFIEEYKKILQDFEIECDERYIFKSIE